MIKNNIATENFLYRYRSPKEENLNVFSKKELFFISPLKINDPFDCKTFITSHDCDESERLEFISYLVKRKHPMYTTEQVSSKARELLIEDLEKLKRDGQGLIEDMLKQQKSNFYGDISKIRILSLSEEKDDLLMWAHYSDGHQGYCLQFDKPKLEKWIRDLQSSGQGIKLAKVIYNNSYPDIRDYMGYIKKGEGSISLDELFLLRKSSHWEYEKEWRIIMSKDSEKPDVLNFPEDILAGIILGINVPDELEYKIRTHLKTWHEKPKFFQAYPNKNKYAVYIKEWV